MKKDMTVPHNWYTSEEVEAIENKQFEFASDNQRQAALIIIRHLQEEEIEDRKKSGVIVVEEDF